MTKKGFLGAGVIVVAVALGGGYLYAKSSMEKEARHVLETWAQNQGSGLTLSYENVLASPLSRSVSVFAVKVEDRDRQGIYTAKEIRVKTRGDTTADIQIADGNIDVQDGRFTFSTGSLDIGAFDLTPVTGETAGPESGDIGVFVNSLWKGKIPETLVISDIQAQGKDMDRTFKSSLASFEWSRSREKRFDSLVFQGFSVTNEEEVMEVAKASIKGEGIADFIEKIQAHPDFHEFVDLMDEEFIYQLAGKMIIHDFDIKRLEFKRSDLNSLSLSLGSLEIKNYDFSGAFPKHQKIDVRDVKVPSSTLSFGPLKNYIDSLGKDYLVLSGRIETRVRPEEKIFRSGPNTLEISDLGKISMDATMGGIDLIDYLNKKRERSMDLWATSPDIAEWVLSFVPDNMKDLSLVSASLLYEDDKLADSLLDAVSGGDRSGLYQMIGMQLEEVGNAGERGQEIVKAIQNFVMGANRLEVTLAPEKPVGISDLQEMVFEGPEAVLVKLGLSVSGQ